MFAIAILVFAGTAHACEHDRNVVIAILDDGGNIICLERVDAEIAAAGVVYLQKMRADQRE
jgi:uncharacterized protein GlcG (DUF336 family)